MHNCIVIHTHFHANAALHTYAFPVIYTDTPTPRINTAHTQICRQNQLITRTETHTSIFDTETCRTYKAMLLTHVDEQTHTHTASQGLSTSRLIQAVSQCFGGLDAAF